MTNFKRFAALFVAVFMLAAPALLAQVTTGNISGNVTAKQDNSALPGVTIEAVHVPTGTRYSSVTGAQGFFIIPSVRVGGPYRVTATLEGFKTTTVTLPEVRLGDTATADVSLPVA